MFIAVARFLCCDRSLAGDDDARGSVRDAHRGVGGVDVLTARTRGAIGINLEIALLDVDLEAVVDHRIDPDAREAGMPPRRAVIGRDAHQPVHAAFGLGPAIGILALDEQRRGLDARLFARVIIDQLDLVAAPLGPARIHALQHLGPVLALGAAGAGVNFEIGVVAVRLAREQRLNLVALGALGKRLQRRQPLGHGLVIALGLAQFDEFDRIGHFLADLVDRADRLFQPPPLAHHLFCRFGIVPQRRVLDARVELVEATQRAVPVQEIGRAHV